MSSAMAGAGRHLKLITVSGVYALVTFVLAGFLVANLPDDYHFGVLVGWVLAVVLVTRVLRGRFLR